MTDIGLDLSGITMGDIGAGLEGVGALAGAWGSYKLGQEQNKLIKDQLKYVKEQDALRLKKLAEREKTINDVFGNAYSTDDNANLIPSPSV